MDQPRAGSQRFRLEGSSAVVSRQLPAADNLVSLGSDRDNHRDILDSAGSRTPGGRVRRDGRAFLDNKGCLGSVVFQLARGLRCGSLRSGG